MVNTERLPRQVKVNEPSISPLEDIDIKLNENVQDVVTCECY